MPWGEAKQVIADLLGVTKDILDEQERRRETEDLAALIAKSRQRKTKGR